MKLHTSKLKEYFHAEEVDTLSSTAEINVKVCIDSRLIRPGDIFVCIKGEKADGHEFIPMAIQKGAIGFLVSEKTEIPDHLFQIISHSPVKSLQFAAAKILKETSIKQIAITGSAGKTTTKEIMFLIFNQFIDTAKTQGNYNTPIGVPVSIINMENDRLVFISELSASYPGEIDQNLSFMNLESAVITGIGFSHLEFFGSTNNIFIEKMKIAKSIRQEGHLLINGDQAFGKEAKSIFPNTLTFGLKPENDIQAVIIKKDDLGTTFHLREKGKLTPEWKLSTFGDHFIYNAIPGIYLAIKNGAPTESINHALSLFQAEKGRGKIIQWINNSTIIDESYNANPFSFAMSLQSFQSHHFTRKIAVIGDMLELGTTSEQQHFELGKLVAESMIDIVIYKGYYKNFFKEGLKGSKIQYIPVENNKEIEQYLLSIVKKGDGILIKASNGTRLQEVVEQLERYK